MILRSKMPNSLRVTVVTVCLNAHTSIDATVQSVVCQEYSNIEYIVIDGASVDGTVERLRSYGNAITRLITETDTGLYNAMNKALSIVNGDIIIFLNAGDCFASPSVIGTVVQLFNEVPTANLVYGDWKAIYPDRCINIRNPQKLTIWNLWLKNVNHQSIFARREVFETVGRFDESLSICADWDWTIRAVLVHQLKAVHFPYAVCHFPMGGLSSSRILLRKDVQIIRRRYYRRYTIVCFSVLEFLLKVWTRAIRGDFSLPWSLKNRIQGQTSKG